MAVTQATVTVGSSPTLLAEAEGRDPRTPRMVEVINSGAATVYLGGANVAAVGADAGRPLGAATATLRGESAVFWLSGNDKLYGVVAAGTQPVAVIQMPK